MTVALQMPLTPGAVRVNPRFDNDQRRYEDWHFARCADLRLTVESWHRWKAKKYLSFANNRIREISGALNRADLNYAFDDDQIKDFAEAKSRQASGLYERRGWSAVARLLDVYGFGFSPEEMKRLSERSRAARTACARWWRRKCRTAGYRVCEQICRDLGLTRKQTGAYVSDFTLRRMVQRDGRNRSLLDNLEATNQRGESFTLSELSDLGVSNPGIRRGELMTRIRGFEEWVDRYGGGEWVPMFYTLTCPSSYHQYLSQGVRNEKYNGATPRDAQSYLCGVWARCRAEFARSDYRYFGFRVAEPHHDGCPHWHLLLFVRSVDVAGFCTVFKRQALSVDPDEPGANEHRFAAVEIDRERGSAAGYIAKYISKNIDGFRVGEDYETGADAIRTAARVRAWASVWGIRQFQQIGGAPVTVWRELRRSVNQPERAAPEAKQPVEFLEIQDAADRGKWAEFTEKMGGAVARRLSRPLQVCYLLRRKAGVYGEPVKFVKGLWSWWQSFPILTRCNEWVIGFKNLGASLTEAVPVANGEIHGTAPDYSIPASRFCAHVRAMRICRFFEAHAPPARALDLCQ